MAEKSGNRDGDLQRSAEVCTGAEVKAKRRGFWHCDRKGEVPRTLRSGWALRTSPAF